MSLDARLCANKGLLFELYHNGRAPADLASANKVQDHPLNKVQPGSVQYLLIQAVLAGVAIATEA